MDSISKSIDIFMIAMNQQVSTCALQAFFNTIIVKAQLKFAGRKNFNNFVY